MKYIPDVHEVFVAPPYNLGRVDTNHWFEAHHVTLAADHAVLEALVDEQLNAALPNHRANLRTTGTSHGEFEIHWFVPPEVQAVDLSFVRYWRSDSRAQPSVGWLAYTEALIQFIVGRRVVRAGVERRNDLSELLYFVGAVYIDDSAFTGQVQDPAAAPILVGREGYGMPKAPGQIFYCGTPRDPGSPKLQIWHNPGTNKLCLTDAIVFNPSTWTAPPSDYCPAPPPTSTSAPTREDRYAVLARQLGMETGMLMERLSPLDLPHVPPYIPSRWIKNARKLSLPSGDFFLWDDLHLLLKLVGLKQFPDPTSVWNAQRPYLDACYQAIVESPVEEIRGKEPAWTPMSSPQVIEFPIPPTNGVDLAVRFGIVMNGRSVSVENWRGTYTQGTTIFANPYRTQVWEPV